MGWRVFVVRHGSFQYMFDDYATLEATGKVPYDPVFEGQMELARNFMRQRRDALRELAK